VEPGNETVFQGERGVGLQPPEVGLQIFRGVVPPQETAVNELIEIRTVIVEP
jgi:hypothetical protein